jgi:hypothetical protein
VRNPYLERLRGQKQHPASPSIPSKPGFEGFEGDQGCRIFGNTWPRSPAVIPTTPTNSLNNATTAYPQNLQNPSSPSVPVPTPTLSEAPDGACPTVEIELPAAGGRYRKAFTHLLLEPPAHISVERWQRAVEDGRSFLAAWGEQADALGWDSRDLFGLDIPPADPHPSYSRLSRYDNTGLCWLLQAKEVIAMTADTATIRNPSTGAITIYRRFNKPALGPVGDSLDEFK